MRPLVIVGIALVLAGCSLGDAGDGGAIDAGQLGSLVLQPDDLSTQFERFDEGRQGSEDAPAGERADPARFGRTDGWKARYRRAGTQRTSGPLVVESRADHFESADGAAEDLAAIENPGFSAIDAPTLGDEARAFQALQGTAQSAVRYYLIAWRDENVTASVLVSGFEGRTTFDQAIELARRQAERISRAAS